MGNLMDEAERTIRRLRADARQQQADAELVVAELAMASRTMRDAVLDHARSGRLIRLELGGTSLGGSIVHVGDELVRMVLADQRSIDVALAAVSGVRVVDEDGRPANVTTGYPSSLLARCRELVQVNARVEIGRIDAPPIIGDLLAATGTHLEVGDGSNARWLLPLDAVGSVSRVER